MAFQPQLAAQDEFRQLRLRGAFRRFVSGVLRHASQLCSFEGAQPRGSALVQGPRTLRDICLGRVVGSVGRAQDYTPGFLPLRPYDEARWVGVRLAAENEGFPPIEVYELGEDYFVLDGHHRVSVLKRLGATSTEAYVTKVAPVQDPQLCPC